MAEKVKAAVSYPPAATGQDQPLETQTTNNVSQPNANHNMNISSCGLNISPCGLKLINMGSVEVEEVRWLWYPYIPFGKVTLIQGDPGDGKTTMILAIAAAVTKGDPLPESDTAMEPLTVIFQTAEDGLGDTIKPRLLQAGADCSRVVVIDESEKELSLCDARIEEAITETGAKLFILDPLQAYLGAEIDMHRANEIRPILKHISNLADKTGCAVVAVGHLNKGQNKSQYRGLGSIDIQAAARSVLTVGRIKGEEYVRAFAQGKNNLAPEGASIAFELDPATGFRWRGAHPITIDELLGGKTDKETAAGHAKEFLTKTLTGNELPANEVYAMADGQDISVRTLMRAKAAAGVRSFKKKNQWFWTISPAPEEQESQDCLEKQECQTSDIKKSLASFPNMPTTLDNSGFDGNKSTLKKARMPTLPYRGKLASLASLPPCEKELADDDETEGGADGEN